MARRYFIVILGVALLATTASAVHDALINGATSATVNVGDDITITFDFEASGAVANIKFYVDVNENGSIDGSDVVFHYGNLIDGSFEDADEDEDGDYSQTFNDPTTFPGHFILWAEDNGVNDYVILTVNPVASSYSISGAVTEPANTGGIMVMAMPPYFKQYEELSLADFTDGSGDYTINIPDAYGNEYRIVMCMDGACAAPGYLGGFTGAAFDSIYVDGHIIDHDITMIESDGAYVSGTVEDDDGNPLGGNLRIMGATFWAGIADTGFGMSFTRTEAKGSGDYTLQTYGSSFATCVITLEADLLWPEYLYEVPETTVILFGGTPATGVDFVIYKNDATISGHVYYQDKIPADDIEVNAESDLGNTYDGTYSDGHYTIQVASEASNYTVSPDPPEGYDVLEDPQDVSPGATEVDFHLVETGVAEEARPRTPETRLLQNYPNPFSQTTVIGFQCPRQTDGGQATTSGEERVTLSIYDLSGRLVKTFPITQSLNNSITQVVWDGTNDKGQKVGSGVYFCVLKTSNHTVAKRMVLLK